MKSMKLIAALLVIWACQAWGASIGLFADPGCSSCNLDIPAPPGVGTLYISVVSASISPPACGVTGAEFRVAGLPTGWVAWSTPSPLASLALGDPFSPGGAYLALNSTQTSDCVLLYTVVLWPASAGEEAVLRVLAHNPPSNPFLGTCPALSGGDCPTGWAACVAGGTLYVNSSTTCTVGVEPSTWSRVKVLYER